jgi:hypothetical protein
MLPSEGAPLSAPAGEPACAQMRIDAATFGGLCRPSVFSVSSCSIVLFQIPNQDLLAGTSIESRELLDTIGGGILIVAALQCQTNNENIAADTQDR